MSQAQEGSVEQLLGSAVRSMWSPFWWMCGLLSKLLDSKKKKKTSQPLHKHCMSVSCMSASFVNECPVCVWSCWSFSQQLHAQHGDNGYSYESRGDNDTDSGSSFFSTLGFFTMQKSDNVSPDVYHDTKTLHVHVVHSKWWCYTASVVQSFSTGQVADGERLEVRDCFVCLTRYFTFFFFFFTSPLQPCALLLLPSGH